MNLFGGFIQKQDLEAVWLQNYDTFIKIVKKLFIADAHHLQVWVNESNLCKYQVQCQEVHELPYHDK